ncbi:Nn.00g074720.m01.CDS01 [Neocucurbitaria sp. VM-36]
MNSCSIFDQHLVIWGHWVPYAEKIDQLLDAFKPVLQYVKQNSDTTPCFYLLREKTKDGGTAAVVTASCFKSRDAYDRYLASKARLTLDETCTKQNLLCEPQREQRLISAAGFPLRSTGPYSAVGIHAAMAKIQYAPGKRPEGIEHWKAVAASVAETEKEGTYTYWFLADPEDENVLYSLERYKDEAYLWDVHVPSKAIQENIANQKHIRTGLLLRGFESVE